ncbi:MULTISPECIES: type II toxin-antitoxin system PemK/MazF family toxin [Deinococcus]|uniref:type II toxin-antitoxin system PemK/MazF family toxin n=1 Tax=Deinococcus TaxID=1298 RepID=UPI00048744C7|nr:MULTISPECIES: type II toxin-antitoxin system PemK/MazF family toxin [Deinococcus]KEF33952.1 hypothetical protein RDMS_09680 [Deinococcus sp. RL]
MRRAEVWLASLAPRSGSEQTGTRPVLVVSSDTFNEVPSWRSFNVVPISRSGQQARRTHTTVPLTAGTAGLTEDSVALCHQITTIDRSKFIRKLGTLPDSELRDVEVGLIKALDMLRFLP